MSVDTAISSGSDKPFSINERDVFSALAPEVLGKPKINQVEVLSSFSKADDKVFGFDVSVDNVLRVEGVHPCDTLLC